MDFGPQNIVQVFSILHDGSIDSHRLEAGTLNLKIEIRYLAEVLHDSYRAFYVSLGNCRTILFRHWDGGGGLLTDPDQIFAYPMEILEARKNRQSVEVSCVFPPEIVSVHGWRGGELILQASEIQVYDEDFNRLSVERLKEVSKEYWKNFTH